MTRAARAEGAFRLIWVATKSPWPPVDGGRLLMQVSVDALTARGIDVEVVAPELPSRASWPRTLLASLRDGLPLAVARHRSPVLEARVQAEIRRRRPTAVHVEQVHSLPQAEPGRREGLPLMLRAQNVESDLWQQAAAGMGPVAPIGRWLARRFAIWEGRAVASVATTLAVTEADREALARLAGGQGRVRNPTVPFPADLPPGEPLAGHPAVSLFVGRGWEPSRRGAAWFLREVWPEVLHRSPTARLHWFGERDSRPGGPGIAFHPAPRESRSAFPGGGILVVPLDVASGIRMKVLEAWSRELPVVGTSRALRGLAGEDGREWLRADDPRGLAGALVALGEDAALRSHLVEGGRRRLELSHAPGRFAADYLELLAALPPIRG